MILGHTIYSVFCAGFEVLCTKCCGCMVGCSTVENKVKQGKIKEDSRKYKEIFKVNRLSIHSIMICIICIDKKDRKKGESFNT